MTDNGICSLLGLAMRAGRLAAGDEPVRELARDGVIRAVFLAQDAGAAVTRQAAYTAEKARAPLLTLPVSKEELGGALGRKSCAMCAVSDSGFAAKAAEKLAALDPAFQQAADALRERHTRLQSRRGVKKHRAADETAKNAPSRPAKPGPRKHTAAEAAENAPSRPAKPGPRRNAAASAPRKRAGGSSRFSAKRPAAKGQKDNNQPLADNKHTGSRRGRTSAIEHPRKLRR